MSVAALASATRAAGAVIALGHLVGLVPGSLVGVVGALGLITFGRILGTDADRDLAVVGAFVVVAGGLGVGALRWGLMDLGRLRDVQAVLGPTLVVGSTEAVVGTAVAAGTSVLALAFWAGRTSRTIGIASYLDVVVAALAVAAIFWGPAVAGEEAGSAAWALAQWVASVVVVAAVVIGLGRFAERVRPVWSGVALGCGAAAIASSAVFLSAA